MSLNTPYKLKFLSSFWVDYAKAIEDFGTFNSIWTAQRFVANMEKKFKTVESFPNGFPRHSHFPEYRKFIVMGYITFFKVNDDAKTVEIRRLINGRMNLKRFVI